MPSSTWLLNVSDLQRAGLLASRESSVDFVDPKHFRNSVEDIRLLPVEQVDQPGFQLRNRSLVGLERLQVAVGLTDQPPTSGVFDLAADAVSTGLTALATTITAGALATALNGNSAVSGKGGVTVTKANNLFEITMVSVNQSITWTSNARALRPRSTVQILNPVAAAADRAAVYTLQLLQEPYAATQDCVVETPNAAIGTFTFSTTTVTCTAHGLAVGDKVGMSTTGTLPSPGVLVRVYWVKAVLSANTLQLATSSLSSASAVSFSGGSGTHTLYHQDNCAGVDTIVAGTPDTLPSFRVFLTPDPISGGFTLNAGQKHSTIVRCTANTAVRGLYVISITNQASDVLTVPLDGQYITAYKTGSNVPVRFWFSADGSVTNDPGSPPGGTRVKVSYVTTPTPDLVSTAFVRLMETINSDATFSAYFFGSALFVLADAGGPRTALSPGTVRTISVEERTKGCSGRLVGKGWVSPDRNGTVGFYIDDGTLTATPAIAAQASRVVALTLTGGETASAVATALATQIAADSELVNTAAASDAVTITDTYAGSRDTAGQTASSGYFALTTGRVGFSNSATLDRTASDSVFQQALGDGWSVAQSSDFEWTVTYLTPGSGFEAPTITPVSLVWPLGILLSLDFRTLSLAEYFASLPVTQQEATTTLEIKATYTGKAPEVWLHIPYIVTRDLIATDVLTALAPWTFPLTADSRLSDLADVAWVDATNGDDDTGAVGDIGHPYETLDAAFSSGARTFYPAPALSYTLTTSTDTEINFLGGGQGNTEIAISFTGGELIVNDLGCKSATLTITANGANGQGEENGHAGGVVTLRNGYALFALATGGNADVSSVNPHNGGTGGQIILEGSSADLVNIDGGSPANGGTAGSDGTLTLHRSKVVEAKMEGTGSTLNATFSEIETVTGTPGTTSYHLSRIGELDYPRILAASAFLNFGSISAQSYAELTISVPGAKPGDVVAVSGGDVSLAGCCVTAFVSTFDTATVRFNNYSSSSKDPANVEYFLRVF